MGRLYFQKKNKTREGPKKVEKKKVEKKKAEKTENKKNVPKRYVLITCPNLFLKKFQKR